MAARFTINESASGDIAILAFDGEIDLSVIAAIRDCIESHLARDTVRGIVVDLSAVTFIDSSGIGELIGCRRRAIDAGRALRALHPRGRVAEVLDLSGVTQLLAGDPL